ncbi:hypothetical protein AVEN_109902-1, partial [Araneus ventricosus]
AFVDRTLALRFLDEVLENGPVFVKHYDNVPSEDCHNIQTHSACLSLLTQVLKVSLILICFTENIK